MEIKRNGFAAFRKGAGRLVHWHSRIDPLFDAPDPARAVGASVTFEPGARTAWHTHPLGQTLIVTRLRVAQRWGGPREEFDPATWSGSSGRKALAWGNGNHGHDAHRHSGET